ncbi:MAG TPA: hypothetical protein VJC02_01190, partial [Candidatus Paceibacterota bacterium]
MLKDRLPTFTVFLSFTVVTGGNEHLPDVTTILDSSFVTVLVSAFVIGIVKLTPVSTGAAFQTEGYFTDNPNSSFLYSESFSETFVVSDTFIGVEEVARVPT